MNNNPGFSPLESLQRALRLWWLITLLGIAGGLLGWLFTRIQPPRYEAVAKLSVALRQRELVPEDELSMSYALQEQYLAPVSDLFYNQEVEDLLVTRAQQQGIAFEHADFNSQDFRVERYYSDWRAIVINRNPQTAASLANLWADAFLEVVTEANQHALVAERLRAETMLLQTCLSAKDFTGVNACAGTTFDSLDDLNTHLQSKTLVYADELQASQGITFALDVVLAAYADAPSSPVMYTRSLLLFAGTALGLIAGAVVAASLPRRGRKSNG